MYRSGRFLILPLALAASHAAAQTVYTNAFTSGAGSEWSNPTTTTSNGETFLGTSANGFAAGTDTLSLSSLPLHDTLTLTFDLYIIQSWDGNGPNGGGVDAYSVALDATEAFRTTFANYGGGNTQAYPSMIAPLGAGANNAPKTGSFDQGHLGFGTGDFGDTTYRITLSLPHTASTAAFAFTSLQNQAPGDEGWGLDNVTVVASGAPVPEPASFAALGAGALALLRRRARRG